MIPPLLSEKLSRNVAVLVLVMLPATGYGRSVRRDEPAGPLARAKAAFERGDCVDVILEAAGVAANSGADGDLAKLYVAQCQEQLGDLALSYQTAKKANPKNLGANQRAALDDLLERLSAPYTPKKWAVTGSAGVMSFKNDQYLKDGFFYDLVGSYFGDSTTITFDYEPSSIKLVDGSTYTQNQMVVVGEQRFFDAYGVKVGYRRQSASASTYDGASNYLIGGRWFSSQSQIGVTYAGSQYPNYYPATLDVSQISAFGSTSFGDISGGPGLISVDAKVHSIKPQMTYSKKTYPTVTPFNDSYNSFEFGLRYSLTPVSFAASLWAGEQVFGVFSDMFAVWNNATVHKGGRKLSFDYYHDATAAFTLFYASDDLKNTASTAASSVSVIGLNASYFF